MNTTPSGTMSVTVTCVVIEPRRDVTRARSPSPKPRRSASAGFTWASSWGRSDSRLAEWRVMML